MAEIDFEPTAAAEDVSPSTEPPAAVMPSQAPEPEPEPETEDNVAQPPLASDGIIGEVPEDEKGGGVDLDDGDHKRKLGELDVGGGTEENGSDDEGVDGVKRQRVDDVEAAVDDSAVSGGEAPLHDTEQVSANGHEFTEQGTQETIEEKHDDAVAVAYEQGSIHSAQPSGGDGTTSRIIDVPNNKVGVLIGKAGDTIKFLQINSGARIQITRDAEADPNSTCRPVELIGTLDHINKAEQLIKDVIAEADAGGSPSLVARGFSTTQSGAEQLEIQVPNEKVGMIIGKGGETIKKLQLDSGARIQLITQNALESDTSKEKTIRISGHKKQIEIAHGMIKEVMNQAPVKHSPLSGGYSQQNFRPRGPTTPQWGPRAPQSQPAPGYGYQQRGTYPPPNTQYPSQPHGGYSQQPPPRSGYSGGWDQRSGPPQAGGYDYYGQGGQVMGTHSSNHQYPTSGPTSNPPPVNYNYGQSQPLSYGQPYGQSAPSQQSYGNESQAANQQFYGQQPLSSQSGMYGQPAPQGGYTQQQPYSNPAYGGAPPSQGAPQPYPPQGPNHPSDQIYQGHAPAAYGSSYGSGGPPQPYPYSSNPQTQPAPSYGQPYAPNSGAADGYTQSAQYGGQVAPGYGQQGGQPVQTSAQYGGYSQYPPQQGYGAQPVANNASYGYQGGPAPDAYGNTSSSSGYANTAPVNGQAGYVQPGSAPVSYS